MPNRALEQRLTELAERLEHVEAVIEKHGRELEIQFQRIAQMQAELDTKHVATESVKLVIEALPTNAD